MTALVQRMDPERCHGCKSRIFRECSAAAAGDPTTLATAAAE